MENGLGKEQGNSRNYSSEVEVLTTRDVARIMKCGVRKIQRLAAEGKLPMKLFGGEYVISRKRFEEYIES
jgi:excisionase family DNA binding protein